MSIQLSKLTMEKILITGANSFVGTNYILNSKYNNIEEISLLNTNPNDIKFSKYTVVFHLVAIVHQSKQIHESEYFRVNRDLCLHVANNAKKAGVRQFIFMSSVKVYGKFIPGSGPWDEKSLCFPEDSYGKSKYEAELLLKKLESPDFIVSIVRTPLVYGEGVKANMYGILKFIDNFRILPFRNVENKRNFTSVENLTAFIDRIILKKAGGTFIAMDKEALSTTHLVYLISKYLDKKVILFKIPNFIIKLGKRFAPKIFDRLYGSFEMDNRATLKKLDFCPPFSTEHGIEKMVKSYKLARRKE